MIAKTIEYDRGNQNLDMSSILTAISFHLRLFFTSFSFLEASTSLTTIESEAFWSPRLCEGWSSCDIVSDSSALPNPSFGFSLVPFDETSVVSLGFVGVWLMEPVDSTRIPELSFCAWRITLLPLKRVNHCSKRILSMWAQHRQVLLLASF